MNLLTVVADVITSAANVASKTTSMSKIPPSAAPAATGALFSGCRIAVDTTFSDRDESSIDQNRRLRSPLPSTKFCNTVAQAYDAYFKTVHAGVMLPQTLGPTALAASLRTFKFLDWGVSFALYWTSAIWLPSGVMTGGLTTNAVVVGSTLQNDINMFLSSGQIKNMDDFADRIATTLSTYTTTLTVQAILSVPPNTTVVTVM